MTNSSPPDGDADALENSIRNHPSYKAPDHPTQPQEDTGSVPSVHTVTAAEVLDNPEGDTIVDDVRVDGWRFKLGSWLTRVGVRLANGRPKLSGAPDAVSGRMFERILPGMVDGMFADSSGADTKVVDGRRYRLAGNHRMIRYHATFSVYYEDGRPPACVLCNCANRAVTKHRLEGRWLCEVCVKEMQAIAEPAPADSRPDAGPTGLQIQGRSGVQYLRIPSSHPRGQNLGNPRLN